MTDWDLGKVVGDDGTDGKGITSITKTGTSGLIDTYTITYTDNTTSTFTLTNGAKGDKGDKGDQGNQGPTGDPFTIYKTYASIALMEADASNVPTGKFVMISSTVSDPDNSKLYLKGESSFGFIADLSGAKGDKGDKGDPGDPSAPGTFTQLQNIINDASSGDIINLDKDYKNTDTTPVPLTVTSKTLTINANGHILDGNNASQVLNISTDANVTINNAIIKNGYSTSYNGGGITLPSNTNAKLILNDCTVMNNNINGNYAGAGAYVGAYSTLLINNCIFNKNTNNGNNGGAILGGSNSTIYIIDSSFTNNTANSGGAIHNATCENTVFSYNTATASTGAGAIREGNAINCVFNGNTASNRTASGAMRGGTATNCRFITSTDTTESTTVKSYVTDDLLGSAIAYINQ